MRANRTCVCTIGYIGGFVASFSAAGYGVSDTYRLKAAIGLEVNTASVVLTF